MFNKHFFYVLLAKDQTINITLIEMVTKSNTSLTKPSYLEEPVDVCSRYIEVSVAGLSGGLLLEMIPGEELLLAYYPTG